MTNTDPVVPLSSVEPEKAPFWTWRRFKQLGPAGVMGLISLAVPPIGGATLAYITAQTSFAETLRDQPWGPPASSIGFGLLGGLALLPTAVLAIFAGWAFHFRVGFVVAVAGFTIAATIGYAIARRFSGRTVVDLIDTHPRWRTIHTALLQSGSWRTFLIVLLLRIPSVPPFAMTNVALATLHVRFLPFIAATAIGVMPRTAAYVWLASSAKKLDFADSGGVGMLAVSIVATLVVLVVITILARRALDRIA